MNRVEVFAWIMLKDNYHAGDNTKCKGLLWDRSLINWGFLSLAERTLQAVLPILSVTWWASTCRLV